MPYPAGYENGPAQKDLEAQAKRVVINLSIGAVDAKPDKEIIALIAYLQRLGSDIKASQPAPAPAPAKTAQANTETTTKN